MVLGLCVPGLDDTPLGPPWAVRARLVGRVARTGLPQSPRARDARQDTRVKPCVNGSTMVVGLASPNQLPAPVRVAQYLYRKPIGPLRIGAIDWIAILAVAIVAM